MTIFSIQVSAPVSSGTVAADAETLVEVIEDLFPLDTEDAYLNWNGVRVALNYKYDVSTILADLLSMLRELQRTPQGESVVVWRSSCFAATWRLSWSGGRIRIDATWEAITGNIDAALTASGPVELAVSDFIAEWQELLNLLARRIEGLGLTREIEGLAELEELIGASLGSPRGLLYRASTSAG